MSAISAVSAIPATVYFVACVFRSSVLVLPSFLFEDTARRRAESAADEADLQENALGHLEAQWGPDGVILSPWILGTKHINL